MYKNLGLVNLIVWSLLTTSCQPFYDVRDWFLDRVVHFVPLSFDESLGERSLDQLKKRYRFVRDSTLSQEVEALVAPLLKVAAQSYSGKLRIHFVDDPIVNAFALPGGTIILPTGFLLFTENAEEVQGVVAHEIAHVLERHSVQSLITQLSISLALQLMLGDASEILRRLVMQAADLLSLKYSRDDEREADQVGVALLKEAHVGTGGLMRFFQRLQATRKQSTGAGMMQKLESMLSTHPLTEERLQKLALLNRSTGRKHPFPPKRFARLQARVRHLQTATER